MDDAMRLTACTVDGDDVGTATYPDMVKVGEELFFGGGRRFRVVDIVRFSEEDEPRLVGMLKVEAAGPSSVEP